MKISYNHRSSETVTSMSRALRRVRQEMGQSRMRRVTVPDGTYCYRSKSDMDRDDTGARAFAMFLTFLDWTCFFLFLGLMIFLFIVL